MVLVHVSVCVREGRGGEEKKGENNQNVARREKVTVNFNWPDVN